MGKSALHRDFSWPFLCAGKSNAPTAALPLPTLLCPQPHSLSHPLALKQVIIQTMQSEQATGNDALLPRCLRRDFSGLLALWGHVCWKPLRYKRIHILCISFMRCVPSKSAGSGTSEALPWADCQLGQGQCVTWGGEGMLSQPNWTARCMLAT